MSNVHIPSKYRILATKSLKRKYKQTFGTDSLDNSVKQYSRDEIIVRYIKNLQFWTNELPEITPGVTKFTVAVHAICSNAISELWKKVEEYDISTEVEKVVSK